MSVRYIPTHQFAIWVNGVPLVFSPDKVIDGELGYPELPKGLTADQRKMFRKVGEPDKRGRKEVVEQATAAPGEKRVTPAE